MTDIESRQKYMMTADIREEVANLVGIDSYDPRREASGTADFRKSELKKIFQAITGDSGGDLSNRELNLVLMKELGSELHAAYPYDLSRKDLKIIHKELVKKKKKE